MREISLTQKARFLNCLSVGMSVTAACEVAGLARRTVYYWRNEDIDFRDAWEDAIAGSVEILEDHLRKRAMDPNDKNAHILLMFLLKKLDPSYRENYKTPEKKAVAQVKEFEFSAEEVDTALGILELAKARVPKDA